MTVWASATLRASWPIATCTPSRRSRSISGVTATSEPETALAAREQDARDRAHADAADADEVKARHRSSFRGTKLSIRARIATRGSLPCIRRAFSLKLGEPLRLPSFAASKRRQAAILELPIGEYDDGAGCHKPRGVGCLVRLRGKWIGH